MLTDSSGDLSADGHLVLWEDPTRWIRKNPTPLLSVRRLEVSYEGIIGDSSIGQLRELTHLSIRYVNTITCLPNILTTLPNLQMLELRYCHGLQALPPNLGHLESLMQFTLAFCHSIKSLPDSFAKLSKLTELNIIECANLEELPANIAELLNKLTTLNIERCRSLNECPSNLNVVHLSVGDRFSSQSLSKGLSYLKQLDLSGLRHLNFKDCVCCRPKGKELLPNLDKLQQLPLFVEFHELPPNLGDLESLTSLSINFCRSIKALPDSLAKLSKLTYLEISSCGGLEELPAKFGELENLTHFTLQDCRSIKSLPENWCVAKLSKLTTLNICYCHNLRELPANLGELKSLTHLSIENCRSLKECPSNLNVVYLSLIGCCSIQSLPGRLSNLNQLHLPLCISSGLENLKYFVSLRYLKFSNCMWHKPKELPANLDNPPQMSVLDIKDTRIKCLPSSITKLSKLRLLLLPSWFIIETLPYQLDESLVISVEDTHVRKTWKELKKEMEIFSSPTVRVDPSGYLPLTGDPTPWIQEYYTSHSMVRILDLELESGSAENITDSIANLTELTHLHITDGILTRLPLQLTKITHLSLYDCEFKSPLDSLGELSTLESLHISPCDTELLDQMDLPVSLRQLTLCLGEDITSLPDSMTKLSNLKALHLFGEGIQFDSLPEILNLEKLKLVDCNIKSLPRGLRHMEILHGVGIMCSRDCDKLGNCFNQLVDVETLSVTCHSIEFFPSIAGLHNLQELQLKDCFRLKKLPENLDVMVNLCTLNVSGTRIKSLPCSLSTLPRLQRLILPQCFPRENLPLEFIHRSVFDDMDDKYYEDMGYYKSDHETSSKDDDNTRNTTEGVNKVVSKESEGDINSQQQISPYQLLNQPDPTPALGDPHGSIESEQLTADNRLLKIQNPCFPSSQLALHPEHGLPPNFQHDFSSGNGKNLLVSENGQNEDNMLGEGYNFLGKDHNPVSHHSIPHLRNQEVGEVEGEQDWSISAKSLKRKTPKCEPDVKITQNERNVEVEDNACESKGVEYEDCSIISPLSSSQKRAAGRPVPIPPDSVFRNYLSCLSPIDSQICINVASCDASLCLYSAPAPDPTHRITVGQAWCIFPDRWLSDFVLNVYLYDIQLRFSETSSKRLILPSLFQGVTLRYDERNPYGCSDCIQEWCLETMSSYIPRDLKTIEKVFIPVLDKNVGHWFLLVFIVQTKMVYILDSLGTTPERTYLSFSVMYNAELQLRGNKLYQLFKYSLDFTFEVVETKKQPNCNDCGMYVLKYIECDTIDEMKNTFYSTEDMRVERLKSLAKLVASKHNNEYRKRFMDVTNVAKNWREMPKNIRVNEEVSKESEEAIIAEQQQTSPQQLLNLPADALSGILEEIITESFSFGRNSQHDVQNGQVDITNSDTGHEITFLKQGNSSCNQKDVSHIENNLDALKNRQIEVNSESEEKKGKRKRNEITREAIQSQFGKKQKDAAIELGVKLSTIKRRCRELGIKKWPSSRLWRRTNKRKASSKSPSKSEYSQHVVECLDGVNQHVLSNPVPDHVSSGCIVENNSTLVATQQDRDSDQRVRQHFDGANLGTSSTIVQPNECTRTIVVKATYKNVQVKVYFSLSSSVELLKEKIGKKLKLEVDKFKMEYQDEDQDWLLVADISDLEDALRVSESSGSNVVRLCIDEA